VERRPDLVRIDDFGVARPVDRGSVQRFKGAKGTYRLLPSPPRFVLLERHAETGTDFLKLRLGGEISAPGMLCDVVALIATAGWRGELIVWTTINATESAARSIFFEASNILGAQSTGAGERLGEIMYKLGALDREQILAVTKKTTPDRRFGETAVDLGYLSRERLFQLVRTQAEEIVYSALRSSEGTFWFVDGFDPARLAYQHRVSAQSLLMEGVRRMDETKYFRDRIPSSAHVPIKLPVRVQPAADLLTVFNACDGQRSVAEVGRTCALPEFETTHALYRLATGGLIQIEPPRPNHPEAIVEIFNGAIRPILKGADDAGRGAQVRERLAAFASGSGIYDALFLGAGPAGDGSLEVARVARNVAPLAGDDPTSALSRSLHDYLAFALFDATTEMPKDRARKLNDEVRDRIAQLAPKSGPSSVYPPAAPHVPNSVGHDKPHPPPLPPAAFAKTQVASPPPPPHLPALHPMTTPPPETRPSLGIERPLPKGTQMAIAQTPQPPPLQGIFEKEAPEPVPQPMFTPVDAASELAHSRRIERRRAVRTSLLVVAMLLLAFAGAASLVVFGVVKIPGLSFDAPPPPPEQPTPKSKPKAKPTATPSIAEPAPTPPPVASPAKPSPPPPASDVPATQGRLVLKAPAGFRVWVDGKVVGETPNPLVVACGPRTVKVGSHGSEQKITVPCGGEIDVYAK